MITSEQQNNSPRQAAVNALISWAKTGWGYYSMRDAVDNYLESCGVNRPSIGGEVHFKPTGCDEQLGCLCTAEG